MSQKKYTSFKDFYPYYLSEHRETGTRITHFIGTSLFFVFTAAAIVLGKWWLVLIGIISAYTMAWIGHFFIEKNKPATFQYPLWSLMGDFKLYFEILVFKESLNGDDPQDNAVS
jgi:hypothetical protein